MKIMTRHVFILYVTIFCTLVFSCSTETLQDTDEPEFTAYQQEKLNQISALNTTIQANPNDAQLYLDRGRAKLFSAIIELEKESIQDLDTAIQLDPNIPTAYYVRAVYFDHYGSKEEKYHELKQAVAVSPESASSHYKIGLFYHQEKKLEQALKSFDLAIEYAPRMHGAYYLEGMIYKELNDFPKAIQLFTKSLEIKPNWAVYLFQRADAYQKSGQTQKAILDYQEVLKYDRFQFGNMAQAARERLIELKVLTH